MQFVNVGVRLDGERVKTKKALKDAVAHTPDRLIFDKTSMFDGGGTLDLDELTQGVTLQVTGPDPYAERKWNAAVKRVDGIVRVS